ncbi:hypothetical protein T492DRAFT_384829 [Pavlovales sp. CCMP2436]|nr:hypothetical protein T492DRAFT_384829 [Pavlovales sp. CCMP2436]
MEVPTPRGALAASVEDAAAAADLSRNPGGSPGGQLEGGQQLMMKDGASLTLSELRRACRDPSGPVQLAAHVALFELLDRYAFFLLCVCFVVLFTFFTSSLLHCFFLLYFSAAATFSSSFWFCFYCCRLCLLLLPATAYLLIVCSGLHTHTTPPPTTTHTHTTHTHTTHTHTQFRSERASCGATYFQIARVLADRTARGPDAARPAELLPRALACARSADPDRSAAQAVHQASFI